MKISKRERFLIRLLMFVCIWALAFRFFIIPEKGRLAEARERLREVKEEQAKAELYLKYYPDLRERLEGLKKEDDGEFFYRDIDDVFMDRNLQELAGRAGVGIVRLSIGTPEPVGTMEGHGEMKTKSHVSGVGTPVSGVVDNMAGARETDGGKDTAEKDTAGKDTAGKDTAGKDTAGMDTTGTDTGGTDTGGTEDTAESGKQYMASTVTLEVKCMDVGNIMEFADGIYRNDKSLVITYIDLAASEEREESGMAGNGGLRGIVEVRYYYEKTK